MNDDRASELQITEIQQSIHMTNLQIIKDLSVKLNVKIPLNNFVNTLENLGCDKIYVKNVKRQAQNIIDKTINLVKYDIRPLNRFVDNSSTFNSIAYDLMLDDNDKLH